MLETHLKKQLEAKPILIMTHMVLGYPSFDDNWKMLEVMEASGADVVELQFPFSEPVADGPLFVLANQTSLDAGTTVDQCFDFFEKASKRFSMPLLMMGYYNTVHAMSEAGFCRRLKDVGGVGAIVPDLPIQYSKEYFEACEVESLAPIQIVTPNASPERIKELADHSKGFVYCVARKGVTGKKTTFEGIDDYLKRVRSITDLPLALGFGVKNHEDIRSLIGKADMAIIGTAGLQAWTDGGEDALGALLSWK